MARRPHAIRSLALAAVAGAIAAATARGQQVAASDIRVDLALDSGPVAHVRATYALAHGAAVPRFQYLAVECAAVGQVSASLGGAGLEGVSSARGPWVDLAFEPPTGRAGPADTLLISYDVQLSAGVARIPLVLPSAPLSRAATITLRLPPGDARPVLPHLTGNGASGTWTAQIRALPSAVRVDLGSHGDGRHCTDPRPAGDAGDFTTRLGLFIATLVLWIPLYFWWASRRPDSP